MEELSVFDCKFVYVKGDANSVADALSRYPHRLSDDLLEVEDNARHPYHFCGDDEEEHVIGNINVVCHVWNSVLRAVGTSCNGRYCIRPQAG